MKKPVEFYGPISIYVRREKGEWAAYIDPFSIGGEGSTQDEAVGSAIRHLTELLDDLAESIKKHGPGKVEVLCPLAAEFKRNPKVIMQAMLFASDAPLRRAVAPTATKVKRLSRAVARKMVAESATIGVIPPLPVTV